ncbi:MAG: OmpH family outer membrane protein [Candidatus Eremiobacteraeota bacterium]|nr:OmpH family outer membrane protein [Candidatus Eremiobacteraeota bacterium]
MRSSSALCAAGIAVALLSSATACARAPRADDATVRGIGYVRLEEVVKKHPLYGQLAQIDSDIDALSLSTLPVAIPRSGAEFAQQTKELNDELRAAQERANGIIAQKQSDYQRREQEAINAAITAAGEKPPSAPAAGMQTTASAQAAAVATQANQDFRSYQEAVIAQDREATAGVTSKLEDRANRQFAQKANELQQSESAQALELASHDSAQRLALRTKLSNLALDDAARNDVKGQLAAIDRKELDEMTVVRNRDRATLNAFQSQLRAQTSAEIAKEVGAIHAQTQAKLQQRSSEVSSQVASQIRGLGTGSSAGLSPATQAKIQQIDAQYKAQFKTDVGKTIADYNETKKALDARFAALNGAATGAQGAAGRQLDQLHKERSDLYNQIVAQVQRETQSVAAARGLKVVFIDVVAPAGGIDLTNDVAKDVESLHE